MPQPRKPHICNNINETEDDVLWEEDHEENSAFDESVHSG
jgi:hypothetical protein